MHAYHGAIVELVLERERLHILDTCHLLVLLPRLLEQSHRGSGVLMTERVLSRPELLVVFEVRSWHYFGAEDLVFGHLLLTSALVSRHHLWWKGFRGLAELFSRSK